MEVLGIDVTPTAIGVAREKAANRGLNAEFRSWRCARARSARAPFATVIDSGVFHIFDDADRARYVDSLAAVLEPGGVRTRAGFSEHTPGKTGPRRVTQAELRAAFADGWDVERIEAAQIEVRPDWAPEPARCWLARIVRTP